MSAPETAYPGAGAREVRFGFAAKLLAALLVTVGVVLVVTLLIVHRQTDAQVRAATARTIEQSRKAFQELESLQRLEIVQLGRAFTNSPRTSAALEAALEGGDMHWLAETARYELALNMLPRSLAAFTDAEGTPVITLIDGESIEGDVARVEPLVRRLAAEQASELLGYSVVQGRLYLMQVQPLDFDGHLIGTVVFGLPVGDDDAARLGSMLAAELCFVAGDRCLAGTPGLDARLRAQLIERAADGRSGLIRRAGARWLLVPDGIAGAEPVAVWRVLAVDIEPVLSPFSDIRRALYVSGFGALGLALLLSTLLARGLTRPVRALVDATGRVARGDYDASVPVARRDELGVLAESFNRMTEGLRLKERYRGVLDKVMSPQVAADLVKGEIRLGGETREVATLFADITGFSELVDGMAPQQVITMLNECMARLETVVQSHDGVVDKYIGDEIMAIFGAPVSGDDDVLRAVNAAVGMQDAMRRLNDERARRGEASLGLAVGLHAGPAVAGNMGSPNRLNYTVLGDSVNLAKRLCSAASAGQVLVSETTWSRVAALVQPQLQATHLGARAFKGFAEPLGVVAVERVAGGALDEARHATAASRATIATFVLAGLLALSSATPAHGQTLPTLEDLGARWSSPGGTVQLALSGRLDLEGFLPQREPAWLVPSTSAFVAGRLRLFTDVFVGERLYGLVELRADRGHAPSDGSVQARVEQAFVRLRAMARPALALQAGRFASPFGAFAARHQTDADPLIRPPLPYDQRTLAAPRIVPGGLDGFLEWKETARSRRPQGTPVVWDVPYPWGALASIGIGDAGARFAVLGSAPSSAPESWRVSTRRFRHPNLMAGVAYRIVPDLSVGVSWNRGPWLEPPASGTLPEGTGIEDFVQETFGADVAYARGRVRVHGEVFRNRWEVPNLTEDPLDTSFYVEATTRLSAGLHVAARYGEIRFNRMAEGTASPRAGEPWDLDQRRIQLGGGYRIVRNAGIRAEYMINHTAGGADPRDNLFSARLWWEF